MFHFCLNILFLLQEVRETGVYDHLRNSNQLTTLQAAALLNQSDIAQPWTIMSADAAHCGASGTNQQLRQHIKQAVASHTFLTKPSTSNLQSQSSRRTQKTRYVFCLLCTVHSFTKGDDFSIKHF